MLTKKNIFVCPLDWGLGHATRLVPVIDELIELGANVIIGADNRPYSFLKLRYPDVDIVKLQGYVPVYPENGRMGLSMIKEFPKIIISSFKSRKQFKKLLRRYKIDAIISDNRYELFNSKVYSVIVTHQLNIQTIGLQKLFKPLIDRLIGFYLKRYNEIWIPDHPEIGLSGVLSKTAKYKNKCRHIGLLSRFYKFQKADQVIYSDVLAILSGPEPQRTILEKEIINCLKGSDSKVIILQGKPEEQIHKTKENISLYSHVNDETLIRMVFGAKTIISRPGYSTLMDLFTLGRTGVFIPTPGQTEQMYLAEKLQKERKGICISQENLSITKVLENTEQINDPKPPINRNYLIENLNHLLKIC